MPKEDCCIDDLDPKSRLDNKFELTDVTIANLFGNFNIGAIYAE